MRITTFLFICMIAALIIGCSGAGEDVAVPGTAPVFENGQGDTGHQLWGLWQFAIDPATEEVEFVALRAGELHLNALHFLEPPANLNLTIEGPPKFSGGTITVDIGLRHPFLGLIQFTGFDVKGILIGHGSETIDGLPWARYAGENEIRLLNADGFTRWWNPTEFPPNPVQPIQGYIDGELGVPDTVADYSATLNGYKYYCDDLADADAPMSDIGLDSRGMFSAGSKNVRRYVIDYTPSGLIFNYAIDASWKFPTGSPPWNAPDDFPPGANQDEAYRIEVHEIANTLGYEVSTGASSGELQHEIDVYDWFDADKNMVYTYAAENELNVGMGLIPIGGGEGYSTYLIDVLPDNLDSADDILLWIAVNCASSGGYGGLLPGEEQGSYFKLLVDVAEVSGSECGDSVHEYVGTYPILDVELNDSTFLGDMGLQEVGPYAGMAVLQTAPNKFSAVDISQGNIGHAVHYFDWSDNNYQHVVDCCPYSGRIALCDPGSSDEEIDIFDVDGNFLVTFLTGGYEPVCLDFDENGDIWYVGYSGNVPSLRHLVYQAGDPYYVDAPLDVLQITSEFGDGWIFGDMAIDYEDRIVFVLGCAPSGGPHSLAAYDISSAPTFLYKRNDVFSGSVSATSAGGTTRYARRLDIEIDHSLAEYCRIVASAQIATGGQYRHELVRLDYELKTMDVYTGDLASAYTGLPSQIIISPNAPHDLIATPQDLGNVILFSTDDW